MELFSFVCFTFCILMVTVAPIADSRRGEAPKFYDVRSYGAVADGKTDDSEAFMSAWDEACHSNGKSRVIIPKGTYKVNSLTFQGPCKGEIGVLIKGTLKAPTDPNQFFVNPWIVFQYVNGLVVSGGGYLDGQGSSAWRYNDCFTNPYCKALPVTMKFNFVNNARVHHLRSINSKNTHFDLYACDNIEMKYLRISAPGNSPNTDGIRIGRSTNIKISRAAIGTGDDCISMLAGTQNIDISEVVCGPGHGISIGSLGRTVGELSVVGVAVRNCSFRGTQNGVRIKTWAKLYPSLAANFVFEDIQMENVNNPVIIDQQYCPQGNCGHNDHSAVQIKNVIFRNIRGSSSSKDAVILKCSQLFPCRYVTLDNINLSYNGKGGPATSSCVNVRGTMTGHSIDNESSKEARVHISYAIFSQVAFFYY